MYKREYEEIDGEVTVLLTAPHAHPPEADLNTDIIARLVAQESRCYALISHVSRTRLDLNKTAGLNHPFRKRIRQLVESAKIKYILDIHGSKRDCFHPQIELGTADLTTASAETVQGISSILRKKGFDVAADKLLKGRKTEGNIIKSYFNSERKIECVQVEIRRDLRDNPENVKFKILIEALCEIVLLLGERSVDSIR
jgi:hypothetical protein